MQNDESARDFYEAAGKARIFCSSCFGGKMFSLPVVVLCFQKKNALVLIQGTKAS
jgi:hypothetical protein